MVEDASRRAAEWLDRTYGGLVTLAEREPVAEGERAWLFGCGYLEDADEPMLASAIAVPRDGGEPFPLANSDPYDESFNLSRPAELGPRPWVWRVNARNCLVATDAAVAQRPASALPWQPVDEAPGWWGRLLAEHFPDADVQSCASWSEVAGAILDGGPDMRGAVWVRRQRAGTEMTGHLLYATNDDGRAVFVDGQRGSLAELEQDASGLVLARFVRPAVSGEAMVAPWEIAAEDLPSAMAKARGWLDQAYRDDTVLVEPTVADQTRRGWLFACTTARFQQTGDWRDQMLDAALVVPKAAGESPFGLPNPDPWTWFDQWDAGAGDLPEPPTPGPTAAWFAPMTQQLGAVVSANAHGHWGAVLTELTDFPESARAVVWVRRRDARGRESVGNLLLAQTGPDGVRLIDAMADHGEPRLDQDVLGLHVVRYE